MQREQSYTHVIWDFNGTVLDDVKLGMDSVNAMLAKRGLPTLPDVAAYRRVFGFPIEAYYRRLGFDFEKEDYHTVLAPEWVALYLAGEESCPLNDGVEETLAAVAGRPIDVRDYGERYCAARCCVARCCAQVMLSATQRSQLEGQLSRLGLAGYFEEILGLDNIHARSKLGLAEDWRRRHPLARPLFVGDTEHDADVAEAIGADCILYAGGHRPAEALAARGKTVITDIRELLCYL